MLSIDDELNCFGRTIRVKDRYVTIHSLFMSDIHTVIFLDDFDSPVLDYAEDISNYPLFRKKTNVDFVYIVNKETIKIKTYERGVGWTLASGSGAAASVVASQKLGYTKTLVNVLNEFGPIKIEITKKGIVYMTGPAKEVFECDYNEEV
jgi:diaminopimelate epimerase